MVQGVAVTQDKAWDMTHETKDISNVIRSSVSYTGRNQTKLHSLTTANHRDYRSSVLSSAEVSPTGLPHTRTRSSLIPQITLAHHRSLKRRIKPMHVWRFKTHYIKKADTCSLVPTKWQRFVRCGHARTEQDTPGERKWEPTKPVRIDRQLDARRTLPTAANTRAPKPLPTTQQALQISPT